MPGRTDPKAVRRRALCCALLAPLVLVTFAASADVYFSPRGAARQRLLQAIRESRASIDVAVYNFTAAELAQALFAARHRGVRVRVILDRERYEEGGATIRALRQSDLPVRALGAREGA